MKRFKTLHELSLIKVLDSDDLVCQHCSCMFLVAISIEQQSKWTLYKNPNADKIKKLFPALRKFISIRPDAVAFVNMNIHRLICPCCGKKSVVVVKGGEYDKECLLESLDA